MAKLRIHYVDGHILTLRARDWPGARAEGIDRLEICGKGGSTIVQGQSIYWCYQELSSWVFGGAPAGYGNLPPEIAVTSSGNHVARRAPRMPDLEHSQVKLGHWRPK